MTPDENLDLAELRTLSAQEVADATGELPEGEYDRMIATVSVRPVPRSWLAALRPGGRIVTTIAQTSLLVSAELERGLVARGSVQPDPASFMRTRSGANYPAKLDTVYAAARRPAESRMPIPTRFIATTIKVILRANVDTLSTLMIGNTESTM